MALLDDALARLEREPSLTFYLDGQLALLDDYLEVRPEARPRVARLAEAGRLGLGPWYVLADELLAGDEPQVRNLLAGRRAAAALGGWLPVGYSPDAFGHPATLPSLLRGFGIGVAVLWRGYGGRRGQERDLFRWAAPDGSEVLVHHLPPAGYEYGANLPADPAAAARRWAVLRGVLEPRATVPVLLLLNGADHHALQPDLVQAVAALRAAAPEWEVGIGTLGEYFDAVGHGATSATPAVVRGELRRSYGYAWTLQGVHATRAGLKREIAEAAALLTRWAEPQATLAAAAGGTDRRPLLAAAWRDHLLTLSHDVLAGSVADPVADDARARARQVTDQARGLLDDALIERLGQDPTGARRQPDRWTPSLVVVNASPAPRGGVVEATVTVFRRDVVVGRPSAGGARPPGGPPPPIALILPDGRRAPVQVLAAYAAHERLDSARDYPDQDAVWAVRLATWVDEAPAFGCLRLGVTRATGAARTRNAGPTPGRAPVVPHDGPPPADLISERDEGDVYTFEPVPGDRPVRARFGEGRTIWSGPLVSAVAWPFRLGDRADGTLYVRADAGSPLLRYVVEGVNRRGNHRLRLVFPIGATGECTADMPYGPVTRPHVAVPPEYPAEWPATTGPMHRYVSAGGSTIFARGLHEYEPLAGGSLGITLLRAVGDLSRGRLRARPGHAGWPTPTPNAQDLGPFRVELAVLTGGASEGDDPSAWAAVERAAEEFHAPLAGRMLRWGIDVPPRVAGPELVGDGLAFKGLKPREDGEGVVARCVNHADRPVEGAWRWPAPVSRAFRARLDETPVEELRLEGDRRQVPFRAAPREIVTIVVEV